MSAEVRPELYPWAEGMSAERAAEWWAEMAHDEWAEAEGQEAATEVDDPWFSWTAGPY